LLKKYEDGSDRLKMTPVERKIMENDLKGYQRNYLRGLAHHLKPILLVGHRGITDMVIKALQDALEQHELIKVKFIEEKSKEDKRAMVDRLLTGTQAQLVGMVGHTAILFKQNCNPEKQTIFLPVRLPEGRGKHA
jgi:RNA-binding protein